MISREVISIGRLIAVLSLAARAACTGVRPASEDYSAEFTGTYERH
ncbi:hypothetical protein PQR14_36665 [Paraburkholderia bryophila]